LAPISLAACRAALFCVSAICRLLRAFLSIILAPTDAQEGLTANRADLFNELFAPLDANHSIDRFARPLCVHRVIITGDT
jgi:hypothetical protein